MNFTQTCHAVKLRHKRRTFGRATLICLTLNSEMTMEDRSSRTGGRERLGLGLTIDDLLFNKGVKGSKEEATGSHTAEQTANNPLGGGCSSVG